MKIGKIFGIEITVSLSWLFVFALVAWSIASDIGPLRGVALAPAQRVILGVIASLLFFASVLIHELAHSLVARKRGVPVRGITLFIFGGVSTFDGEPRNAPSEAWISAVGPLTSLLLGVLFWGIALGLGAETPFGLVIAYLAFANVALAVFNILPAFPLDGGRVLHALVWRATGDRLRATRIAANVGAVLAGCLIVYGIGVTLLTGFGGGLWMTFVGWFLLQAGNAERRQSELQGALAGHVAGDLTAPTTPRLPADATVERAFTTMRETQTRVLPVYLAERFIGYVAIDDLAKLPPDQFATTYVTAIMTRPESMATLAPTDDARQALAQMARDGSQAVAVINAAGDLTGLITRESVLHWLSNRNETSSGVAAVVQP